MDLAFNDPRPFEQDEPRFDDERVVGAFDADDLVGTVMTHQFTQTFGRRSVPCGGVAGVTVAPQARGRGLGRKMLIESFVRMADRGEVVSALYPTTSPLYSSVGYAVGGDFARRRVPFRALGPFDELDWAPCEYGCADMRAIQREQAERHDGWVVPSPLWWDHQAWRRSATPANRAFSFIGRRKGVPVATVVYTYGPSDHLLYDVQVQLVAGLDTQALRSAFGFVAANGSTADSLETTMPSHLLDIVVHRPELVQAVNDWPWMLRIIDLPGAISSRGYAPSQPVDLDLDVSDPDVAANNGQWHLSIADGIGRIEPGGTGSVRVDIRALARIYAGADPHLLGDDGALDGIAPDDCDRVAAAFSMRATLPMFF